MLQLEAVSRSGEIGTKLSSDRVDHAVEEHSLDPHVVVEVLEMPQPTDGAGTAAKLNHPQGVVKTSSGVIYITDLENYRVRKLSGDTLSTVAGDGMPGYKDDDDKSVSEFYGLEGLSVKPDGSRAFVADGTRGEDVSYNRIRMINL